jgi:hypothetical protein
MSAYDIDAVAFVFNHPCDVPEPTDGSFFLGRLVSVQYGHSIVVRER